MKRNNLKNKITKKRGLCKALKASFSPETMGETVRISSLECKTEIKNFLTVMKTTSEECINFGRDEIISKGLNDTVYNMMGW